MPTHNFVEEKTLGPWLRKTSRDRLYTRIRRCRPPFESVLTAINAFEVELLTCFDPVLFPDLSRRHDLAF